MKVRVTPSGGFAVDANEVLASPEGQAEVAKMARVEMDASARESLAEHCERRAKEIRFRVKDWLPDSAYRAQELGAARALEEIAVWARTPPSERVVGLFGGRDFEIVDEAP